MSNTKFKIPIKVVPGSSKNAIAGWMGDTLRIKVMAPPEKGKANQAVEQLIARALGLAKGDVSIVSGQSSPQKVVEICGLSEADALLRLHKPG